MPEIAWISTFGLYERQFLQESVEAGNDGGGTALYIASFQGQRLLASGADIHAVDDQGFTSLVAASQEGHGQVVQCLIYVFWCQGTRAALPDGETALYWASVVVVVENVEMHIITKPL